MSVLYTEPKDEKDYISIQEEGQTIWMDIETWFNPYIIYSEDSIEKLVPELREFILRWRENAEKAKETFVPSCPEKNAGTKFIYKDNFYKIPGMPGIDHELYAYLALDMERELKQMGCKWITYTGSID
ncbi:MAG: hypothetical protein K2N81_00180 [Acetatifactor sp.]|nr:hypothetical protein [Acetatifactor sp.]